VADRRQAGQVEGEAAHRLPIGRSVAWSWCRLAGRHRLQACARLQPAWLVLAGLDHRQFFRAFSLSIGAASHEATTAPVSGGTGWRSPASGTGRQRDATPAADRGCRGLVVVSACRQASVADVCQGCRRRGSCWRDSITGRSAGASPSRSVKPATRRQRRQHRAVPGGRSPASGPARRRGNAPAADRAFRGLVVVSACRQASVADVCQGCRRRGSCWRDSITGSSSGPSSSRLAKPATKRRRRQGRAVPGGDRRQAGQGDGEAAQRLPIGRAVAWSWCRVAIAGKRCQVEGEAAHRQPIGRAVAWSWCRVAGKPRLPWSDPCWRCSITGSSSGSSSSRLVKPATRRRRRQGRAVPGGDRRQVVPGRRRGSTPAADRACRGLVVVSGGWQAAVAVV
jgi:hypothetical protein